MRNRIISGTFNATNADLYVCIGFVPDWVKIRTLETTDEEYAEWSINDRSLEQIHGRSMDDDGTVAPDAYATGIAPYRSDGLALSADSTTYIVRDPDPDKRDAGAGSTIDTWSLDTSGSRTGHWNAVCSTTYVGEGSRICIDGVWYTVTALTSNGEQDDEVTLNEAAASGTIEFLGGMYDFIGATSGTRLPDGFFIDSTCPVNSSGELCRFEAGLYY